MTFMKFKNGGKIYKEPLKAGIHYVKVAINEVPLFIRNGRNIKVVKESVIKDKSLRKSIMDCSVEYSEEDFEII